MKTQLLRKETFIPAPPEKVWQYFSSPHNLMEITPKYMNFKVTKCPDVEQIFTGMLIEYKVSPVLGIPLKWITKIEEVVAGQRFTDTQLKGPFALWKHTHTFSPRDGGTFMVDEVRYRVPLGPLGSLAHWLFVKKQLEGIFKYRTQVIGRVFPGSKAGGRQVHL